jgi:protein-S-isoprenylcysteine O-methyltransferase Ste14
MNWIILTIFGIAVILLIVFLVVRNKKDEEDFEEQLKDDYPKPINEKKDEEVEERIK